MRLVMMGTGGFAEPTFKSLLESDHSIVGLVTQPDRETGQQRASTRQIVNSMKRLALNRAIPVLQPESINTPGALADLLALQPDLLVVAAYGQILSRDVLAAVPKGGINVHASLLPSYRGAAPIAWAIYHGETQTGVTIIRMSASLDAGDILAQASVDIEPQETSSVLEGRLATLGAGLAVKVIDEMVAGTAQGRKQDRSQVSKAPKLTKEHGLIDWQRNARELVNQIRAMQPWPTAYTFRLRQNEKPLRIIIYQARFRDSSGKLYVPGEPIIDEENLSRLVIAAGQGSELEILEMQPAGKRRMTNSDFLRGSPLQPGDRFGLEI